jgi:hypothetical protein
VVADTTDFDKAAETLHRRTLSDDEEATSIEQSS